MLITNNNLPNIDKNSLSKLKINPNYDNRIDVKQKKKSKKNKI